MSRGLIVFIAAAVTLAIAAAFFLMPIVYGEHTLDAQTGKPIAHNCKSVNGGFMDTNKPLIDLSGNNCPSLAQNLITNLFSGLN